jgi:hypothetical protein
MCDVSHGLARRDDERACTLQHGLHLRHGKNPAGELGEIAVMQKLCQHGLMRDQR